MPHKKPISNDHPPFSDQSDVEQDAAPATEEHLNSLATLIGGQKLIVALACAGAAYFAFIKAPDTTDTQAMNEEILILESTTTLSADSN